jgi:YD repeat-containing protein
VLFRSRSNGSLVGTVTTDVGATVTSTYATTFTAVKNWNGQVNLSTSSLAPDTYRVDIEIRDDAVATGTATTLVDNTDGTWIKTGTQYVTIAGAVTRTETSTALTTTTSYDAQGNATVSKDVGGNYSYKVYDLLGRVQYEIDAGKYLTAYTYDGFGNQLTLKRYATALTFGSHPQAFTASEVQALIKTSADDRTITNVYDLLGQVSETRQPAVYSFDSSAAAGSQYFTASPTTRNTYDAFGHVIKQSSLKN